MPDDNSAGRHGAKRADDLAPISERQLARLWERRAARSTALRTDQGARVRVLYSGRPGVTAGPDFRNAVVEVEGQGVVRGDVEVHLRQRDWVGHGHQRDPNYNGVALHVALEPDAVAAITVSGVAPPVVGLRTLVEEQEPEDGEPDEVGPGDTLEAGRPGEPDTPAANRTRMWQLLTVHGYLQPSSSDEMIALLNRAGDERFLSRSRLLAKWLQSESGDQTLWEAICQALGYRNNQHVMVQLAAAAPVAVLVRAARRLSADTREAALTAWLLRWAGFTEPGGGIRGYAPPTGLGEPLTQRQWRLFRVRPANHPRRRLMGAASLVARFAEVGLSAGLYRAAASGRVANLTASLTVAETADGGTAPIGAGRARDIAVNAVLPYLHGWRMALGDPAGAEAMLGLYRSFGRLPDNEVTRHMVGALFPAVWRRVANNARRQQGLIHLQRLLAGASLPDLF